MTGIHKEIAFEDGICAHLAAHGWLYEPDAAARYDRARALLLDDLVAWVQATQPEAWDALTKANGPAAATVLADRLRAALDRQGTLEVLRAGLDVVGLKQRLALCQFRPALAMNDALQARYAANRLRVVRQVRYSLHGEHCLDLVLFLNGIPVATVELKSDYTQKVQDAVDQYRFDRLPKAPGKNLPEPLLAFPGGALVHFAVSNSEAQMCTLLAGADSKFLPFNRGHDFGAGNPPNPNGAPTAYLWEEVWQRDGWLEILGRYLVPVKDNRKKLVGWIFPRFHQLDATRKLVAQVLADGPGGKYLIEHSAGSGKTNSIAWTAHFLADLHDGESRKVFDTVLVVSDRTVLDKQLREAIEGFERTAGVVAVITGDGGAKSGELATALAAGKKIVVCTIQTFPFALKAVRDLSASNGKRFAVIADEAHSSQAGQAAAKLKMTLTAEEQKDLDDGGEASIEDLLAAEMSGRVGQDAGITFVAFTATPKAKTLELFGRRPEAFKQYHTTASLADVSDPNVVLDLRNKLDAVGYYDQYEVERVAKVAINPKATQGDLDAAIGPVSGRLLTKFKQAQQAFRGEPDGSKAQQAAKDEMDALWLFKRDLGSYVRVYEFLGQMFDYGNTDFEKLYLFAKMLLPLLDYGREREGIDLSALKLTHHRMRDLGQQKLNLGGNAPAEPLTPVTETGSGQVQDKHKLRLQEIISAINDLFEGEITEGDAVAYVDSVIKTKMLESDLLRSQAAANTKEQFTNSPNLSDELMNAIMDAMAAHQVMSKQALNSESIRARMLATLLGPGELWAALRVASSGGSNAAPAP